MELIERLDAVRERWNLLEHPFYRRWSCGELTPRRARLLRGRVPPRRRRARRDGREDRQRGARAGGSRPRAALGRVRGRLRRGHDPRAEPRDRRVRHRLDRSRHRLEALAVMYAIEAGQPAVSRRSSTASPTTTELRSTSRAPRTSRSTPSSTTSTLPSRAAPSSRGDRGRHRSPRREGRGGTEGQLDPPRRSRSQEVAL